eukprot:TRINITY_DN6353_c0_g1_i15.p1 TRINITY_DN6353_c0_g1~~TRINITY_DN6353_c0_g1_i15.p1  ORF type:complete len:114 (+),score=1.47 TRINITY_DN6353_c0_g1_i15:5114-5455(+)
MKLLIYISLTLLHFAFYCDTALFTGTSEASTRSTTLKVQVMHPFLSLPNFFSFFFICCCIFIFCSFLFFWYVLCYGYAKAFDKMPVRFDAVYFCCTVFFFLLAACTLGFKMPQ